jgi:hypothetical protein
MFWRPGESAPVGREADGPPMACILEGRWSDVPIVLLLATCVVAAVGTTADEGPADAAAVAAVSRLRFLRSSSSRKTASSGLNSSPMIFVAIIPAPDINACRD